MLTVVYESVDLADPFADEDPVGERTAEVTSRPLEWTPEQAREREASRIVVETLDLHCAGEPLRLIRSGYPAVPQLPIHERRAWVREQVKRPALTPARRRRLQRALDRLAEERLAAG